MRRRLELLMVATALVGCGKTAQPAATRRLAVAVTVGGNVVSTPAGIVCSAAAGPCAADFAGDTAVALTARPDPGSRFVGWSGDCAGAGACTPTMDRDRTVN